MKGKPLAPAKAAAYMRELVRAVAFLHENSIMHRDIKCANLMLSDGKLKLGDFGTACRIDPDHEQTEMKGTLRFMAPEVAKEEPHDTKCDIWSIGCTLMEMLTGRQPMPHIEGNYLQTIAALCRMEPGDVVPIPKSIVGLARGFIQRCLQVDPEKRPTAKTLLSDPFLTHNIASDRKKMVYEKTSMGSCTHNPPHNIRSRNMATSSGTAVSRVGGGRSTGTIQSAGRAAVVQSPDQASVGFAASNASLVSVSLDGVPATRFDSDYYDRKFSGWGMEVPVLDPNGGGGGGSEADDRKFSGWGIVNDDVAVATDTLLDEGDLSADDVASVDSATMKRASVWCDY
eukprot:PhM_4_TR2110/c1_g3_i1/m.57491